MAKKQPRKKAAKPKKAKPSRVEKALKPVPPAHEEPQRTVEGKSEIPPL
jgi:hypothetical protein